MVSFWKFCVTKFIKTIEEVMSGWSYHEVVSKALVGATLKIGDGGDMGIITYEKVRKRERDRVMEKRKKGENE